ncbi:hypothetical protein ES695_11945 [Candidatus Atribacteria bacterium 1244-E10-H5-B2]|nr:MAG: hypothetical protein ES695_11945 [Candidatus Atribacteria bacterium 1244-E10-H5-B2]
MIDICTVFLFLEVPGVAIPAETDPKYDFVTDANEYLTDHDEDGISERMVMFDGAVVQGLFGGPADPAILKVTGELEDGTLFKGSDTIRVIEKDKP